MHVAAQNIDDDKSVPFDVHVVQEDPCLISEDELDVIDVSEDEGAVVRRVQCARRPSERPRRLLAHDEKEATGVTTIPSRRVREPEVTEANNVGPKPVKRVKKSSTPSSGKPVPSKKQPPKRSSQNMRKDTVQGSSRGSGRKRSGL